MPRALNDNKFDSEVLDFSKIQEGQHGKGFVYVTSGAIKMATTGQPYIRLYLQDKRKVIIPAYIFNISYVDECSNDLNKLERNVAYIEYRNNYNEQYGTSLILGKVCLVQDPEPALLMSLIDVVDDFHSKLKAFTDKINKYGSNFIMKDSLLDYPIEGYGGGKIGGLLEHLDDMLNIIIAHKGEDENLIKLFKVYVIAKINYEKLNAMNELDIKSINKIISVCSSFAAASGLPDYYLEIPHMMFGIEPRSVDVRYLYALDEFVKRTSIEKTFNESLPVGRSGKTIYGEIKKYST